MSQTYGICLLQWFNKGKTRSTSEWIFPTLRGHINDCAWLAKTPSHPPVYPPWFRVIRRAMICVPAVSSAQSAATGDDSFMKWRIIDGWYGNERSTMVGHRKFSRITPVAPLLYDELLHQWNGDEDAVCVMWKSTVVRASVCQSQSVCRTAARGDRPCRANGWSGNLGSS